MRRISLCVLFACLVAIGCKTVSKTEEPKKYHDIELICGNESTVIAGKNITTVLIAMDPKTNKKQIVEVYFDEIGLKTANILIKRNLGNDLSALIPGRILLVGRMNEEIKDGKISISSYSQGVAEEIVELLTKR
jgi:preprotein translocase subunit SecD